MHLFLENVSNLPAADQFRYILFLILFIVQSSYLRISSTSSHFSFFFLLIYLLTWNIKDNDFCYHNQEYCIKRVHHVDTLQFNLDLDPRVSFVATVGPVFENDDFDILDHHDMFTVINYLDLGSLHRYVDDNLLENIAGNAVVVANNDPNAILGLFNFGAGALLLVYTSNSQ